MEKFGSGKPSQKAPMEQKPPEVVSVKEDSCVISSGGYKYTLALGPKDSVVTTFVEGTYGNAPSEVAALAKQILTAQRKEV